MLGKIAKTIFGSANDRFIKKQYKLVQKINALEADISKLSDEELKNILTMIGEYISERKSDGYDLKASVKGEICYNIPVKEFQDLIRDSEYAHINLMELKKQLKRQGYTICSTGRYDRTVHNSAMGKAEKVMSFSQKAITTLPELPETEAKEWCRENLINV